MRNGEVQTSDGLPFPIDSILKRRNVNEAGEISLTQLGATSWSMTCTIAIMEDQPTAESIKVLSDRIINTYNIYSTIKRNNMFKFVYCGEITEGVRDNKLEALDHYCMTKDVVSFVKNYYEEEIRDRSFYETDSFSSAFFGREENTNNVQQTIENNDE